MNLINRNLLVSNLRAYRRTASQHNSLIYLSKAYDAFISEVARMPTVEAEPVRHGHYIKGDNGEWYCSECRRIDDKYSVAKYCWNCGAKMDGEA